MARPDVIHYHAEGPRAVAFCALVRYSTVATIHGLDWQRAKWGKFASTYLKLGERTAATCADEVIVLSRNVQRYFKDTYGRDVRFIPNGIERNGKSVPANEITRKYGLVKDGMCCFVPEKRRALLIEAFKQLDTKKLVIAGGSSDSAEYYAQRCGYRSSHRVDWFYRGSGTCGAYSNAYLCVA